MGKIDKMNEEVTLVVSSCDKYEDAWYPYFELIKKYWPKHPSRICLITEKKKYTCDGLNIETFNYDDKFTWSERLFNTLEQINTKYIIFSLEDFFLRSEVNQEKIDKCIMWMNSNSKIAVCRLYASDNGELIRDENYDDFRIATNKIHYRLETQMAIWNRESLLSFIDLSENPWQFESKGTKRIQNTEKVFLWYYPENNDKIVDYSLHKTGYGISYGHWLWNNKNLFIKEGINNVCLSRLGTLSKNQFEFRNKHYYNKKKTRIEKIIYPFWRGLILGKKGISIIKIFGIRKGILYTIENR